MPNKNSEITNQSIADALLRVIAPFYKGFPDAKTTRPHFRKTLSSQETQQLLYEIHTIVTLITLNDTDNDKLPLPQNEEQPERKAQ